MSRLITEYVAIFMRKGHHYVPTLRYENRAGRQEEEAGFTSNDCKTNAAREAALIQTFPALKGRKFNWNVDPSAFYDLPTDTQFLYVAQLEDE